MNVYQKLQKCRVELKAVEIKESGNNKFAGYTYMELGDFLPHIVDLCDKHNLCTVISFGDMATLEVVNSENPEEKVLFTSPMSTAELKGCHAIQNLGAVETYLRRYLYVAAFDIVEHDALDSTQGKDQPTKQGKPKAETQQQPTKALSGDQAKYFPRIKAALDTLHGSDIAAKKATIKANTAMKATDKFPAKEGIEDYRTLDGKRVEYLAHALEKLAAKVTPELCNECRQPVTAHAPSCPNNSPQD